ncbi:MAG: homocysteine S-methyltransferase family protein [Candidatus Hydrogenedentota bacterium]
MNSIVQDVRDKGILLSDGGWGSELIAQGLAVGECPESWNLDHREAVLAVARSYADAGPDLITTNTFGGSRIQLDKHGLGGQAAAINREGAAISREAMGPGRHVNASIGPSGEILMMGAVTGDDLYAAFKEQAVAFEEGGADACLVETMMDLEEATTAIRAVKENTNLEVVCTMTFQRAEGDVYNTMMGITPQAFVEGALDAGASVIGANCTLGPAELTALVKQLREAAPEDVPVMVQPNAGQPVNEGGGLHYPETPESFAAYVPRFIDAGARILGGCCGTGPAHIAAMRDAIDKAKG